MKTIRIYKPTLDKHCFGRMKSSQQVTFRLNPNPGYNKQAAEITLTDEQARELWKTLGSAYSFRIENGITFSDGNERHAGTPFATHSAFENVPV